MICLVCGDTIENDNKYCSSCGSSIYSGSIKDVNFIEKVDTEKSENKFNPSVVKFKKETQEPEIHKNLSSTKLFYFVLFLFLIGAMIVYSSGMFDKTISIDAQQVANTNNPNAGVDLNNLAEINKLEDIVQKNPNDKNTLLQFAHLLNDSGSKVKAIDRYNQYLRMEPNNADVLVDMGVCYFETGKNANAISSMEKAIKIQPNHQIAHLNLGIVNMSAGNSLKAIEYWKKAVELNPTNEIAIRAQELIKQH